MHYTACLCQEQDLPLLLVGALTGPQLGLLEELLPYNLVQHSYARVGTPTTQSRLHQV